LCQGTRHQCRHSPSFHNGRMQHLQVEQPLTALLHAPCRYWVAYARAYPPLNTAARDARDTSRSEAQRYGASLMLAGAAAMGYHSLPKGRLRSGLRKLDHWTISLATSAMVPAIFPTLSPVSAHATSLLQNGAQIGHQRRSALSWCLHGTGSPRHHRDHMQSVSTVKEVTLSDLRITPNSPRGITHAGSMRRLHDNYLRLRLWPSPSGQRRSRSPTSVLRSAASPGGHRRPCMQGRSHMSMLTLEACWKTAILIHTMARRSEAYQCST